MLAHLCVSPGLFIRHGSPPHCRRPCALLLDTEHADPEVTGERVQELGVCQQPVHLIIVKFESPDGVEAIAVDGVEHLAHSPSDAECFLILSK